MYLRNGLEFSGKEVSQGELVGKPGQKIIFLLVLIAITFSACHDDTSPVSPIQHESSITGFWNENFYGPRGIIFFPIGDPGVLVEPDSILNISRLRIDADSFYVTIYETCYFQDSVLNEREYITKGIYSIYRNRITFTDTHGYNEEYIYKITSRSLELKYAPFVDAGNTIILIPSDTGILWGRQMKYNGIFKKMR